MAIFNGKNWTIADFLPFKYVEIWDTFWGDVLAEMGLRAAAVGNSLVATSATNDVPIGTGAKTLTVQAGKGFAPNMTVVCTDAASSANAMTGSVTSYDGATGVLVIQVPAGGVTGGGTPASWKIGISGATGPQGPSFTGGALISWLLTYAGVDASNLGLRIGEATSGFYRSGAGVIGFVANTVEVFRTASSGVITFLRAARSTPVALTDAATIAWDLNAGNYYTITLGAAGGASRTLAMPTNAVAGQSGRIICAQDNNGNRALNYAAGLKWPGGVVGALSTTPNAIDVLYYYVHNPATHIQLSLNKDFK
ncbi:hypothetical protein [Azospirillum endophyticum]